MLRTALDAEYFGPSAGPLPSRPALMMLTAQSREHHRPLGGPVRRTAFSGVRLDEGVQHREHLQP